MISRIRHDIKDMSWRQKVCHYINTFWWQNSSSWLQKVCHHDLETFVKHDVKKFVMTSKNTLWYQKIRHDAKNKSWHDKFHDVKNTSWQQVFSWHQKVKCPDIKTRKKVRHDVKNNHDVITSKTRHDAKRFVMTSKRRHDVTNFIMSRIPHDVKNTSWRQNVCHGAKIKWVVTPKSLPWRQ